MDAIINKEIIKWAIQRRNLDPDTAASKLSVNPDILNSWIDGNSLPSIQQALSFAKKFNIPFGYLYLSTKPDESLPLPDLRTITGTAFNRPSPEFIDVLYDSLRKQNWYHDYLKQEGIKPIPFVAKFTLNDDPNLIAKDMRDTLIIDNDFRQDCEKWEDFFTHFVNRAEKVGVLVLQSGIVGCNTKRKLNLNEFRGFAISDELAPLIFINSNDYKTAEIFTLAHELAHLWIGKSGVSNLDYRLLPQKQRHKIDQHCDRIAAEILVPHDDFLMRWNYRTNLNVNLARLSRYYKVSAFVILRRSYEYQIIDEDKYKSMYDELLAKITPKKSKGGDFYRTLLKRNSVTLTRSLITATNGGRILPTEAAKLLNIKFTKLNSVENYLLAGV